MFEHVEPYAGDPILTLNENFQKDPRPGKINLSIGIYFDDAGRLPVMDAVRTAEAAMLGSIGAKPYQPMVGAANYREQVQALIFGAGHPLLAAGRVATIQTLGLIELHIYRLKQPALGIRHGGRHSQPLYILRPLRRLDR